MTLGGKIGKLFPSSKDFFTILQSIATIIALILAAWWFIEQQKTMFNADISHLATHYKQSKSYNILFLDIGIKNIGNVPLEIYSYIVRVRQVSPLTLDESKIMSLIKTLHEPEMQWEFIKEQEVNKDKPILTIRSGEMDRIHTHFFIDEQVKLIEIESIIKNKQKDPLCWGLSTLYEFK